MKMNQYNIMEQLLLLFLIRYFIGIPFMRPGQRHLYRVSSIVPRLGSTLRPATCLTCNISSGITSDDRSERRISSSNRKNSLINQNEWHDRYETQTDHNNNEQRHQARETFSKKDKSKDDDISSESQIL